MAAVKKFRKLSDFPRDDKLSINLQRFGNHNDILLKKLKKWLSESAKLSKKHKYPSSCLRYLDHPLSYL